MNISYNWLREIIDLKDEPERVGEILTELGLEVGSIELVESIKGGLKGLVVGEVLACEKHPDADKLKQTQVSIGGPDSLQIVCGAPNVAVGMKVVVATIGTTLYSGKESFEIRKSKIRGVVSEGMLCGEDEIGLGTRHDGLLELPSNSVVGTPLSELFPVSSDFIIEVDITPNRADALSHYGVARDLAAYYEVKGQPKKLNFPTTNELVIQDTRAEVRVEDESACPKYMGLIAENVLVQDSPKWLQDRLKVIGLKPINNVVDITNLVLMELGQPLHAFDYHLLGDKVVVKKGFSDVELELLDGTKITVDADDLVISDGKKPLCLAGVMGGLSTAVSKATTTVFLEAAYFNPIDVRVSSKRHGIKTDSSYRFERGVDPNITLRAISRAAHLLKEITGATITSGPKCVGKDVFDPFEISFSSKKCNNLLGTDLSNDALENIFSALEIKYKKEGENLYKLSVPAYRVDVQREVDVFEEVLRIHGYNNVNLPSQLKSSIVYEDNIPDEVLKEKFSDILIGSGFSEILNNSLTKATYFEGLKEFQPENLVSLLNPLSNDLGVMRRSLLFGGLETILRNQNMKQPNLKLFEFGKIYWRENDLTFGEEKRLILLLSGEDQSATWQGKSKLVSFYSLKGYVEMLLSKLQVKYKRVANATSIFDTAVDLTVKNQVLVSYGLVNEALTKKMGIKQAVYYADFNWTLIHEIAKSNKVKYRELNRFHPVKRDLSLLLDRSITFEELEKLAYQTNQQLISEVELFDVYQGDKLPSDKKSYALSFKLESNDETLKDQEIDAVMKKLISNFEQKLGAQLR